MDGLLLPIVLWERKGLLNISTKVYLRNGIGKKNYIYKIDNSLPNTNVEWVGGQNPTPI